MATPFAIVSTYFYRRTQVADTCLSGLTALLSSRNELVVAESVVVIKKLLQIESGQHNQIIRQMARLLDKIQVREPSFIK